MAETPTELILIRHGVTTWNQAGRFQGSLDIDLAPEGVEQALRTAARLADTPLAAVYSSDLSRARRTAEPILVGRRVPLRLLPAWQERFYGDFQGLTGAQIEARDPIGWQRWRAREPGYELPGGGESLQRFFERVQAALQSVRDAHPGQTVVVVTHGGVLDCVYRLVTGLPLSAPRRHDLLNASLNRIRWQHDRWEIQAWADVAHLDRSLDER